MKYIIHEMVQSEGWGLEPMLNFNYAKSLTMVTWWLTQVQELGSKTRWKTPPHPVDRTAGSLLSYFFCFFLKSLLTLKHKSIKELSDSSPIIYLFVYLFILLQISSEKFTHRNGVNFLLLHCGFVCCHLLCCGHIWICMLWSCSVLWVYVDF